MQTLAEQYRDMHSRGVFRGTTWKRHSDAFMDALHNVSRDSLTIVDWGCGPLGGLKELVDKKLMTDRVISYDPYVPQYSEKPDSDTKIDVIFSSDVLEHMDQDALDEFLEMIWLRPSIQLLFLVISTRAADKLLPDGRNAHLTVMSDVDWRCYLSSCLPTYVVESHQYSKEYEDVVLVFKKAL